MKKPYCTATVLVLIALILPACRTSSESSTPAIAAGPTAITIDSRNSTVSQSTIPGIVVATPTTQRDVYTDLKMLFTNFYSAVGRDNDNLAHRYFKAGKCEKLKNVRQSLGLPTGTPDSIESNLIEVKAHHATVNAGPRFADVLYTRRTELDEVAPNDWLITAIAGVC